MTKFIEVLQIIDFIDETIERKILLNVNRIESIVDIKDNKEEKELANTIIYYNDGHYCIKETFEQIKEMING